MTTGRNLNSVTIGGDKVVERPIQPKIVIDGNDGTGKSTLIRSLEDLGYVCQDRGLPTKMTDDYDLRPTSEKEIYLILDAPVETSRRRLALAGRDLNERFHTVDDLTHYRKRFLEVAKLLPTATVIDADRTNDEIVGDCVLILSKHGILPVRK